MESAFATSISLLGLNFPFIFFPFKDCEEFQPPYCCVLPRFMLNMYFPASRDADSVSLVTGISMTKAGGL